MRNISILLIVVVLLDGCSKPTDTTLPRSVSRYWHAEMKQVMEKLQPEEQELLTKFMNRHMPTIESGGVAAPIAEGTTIKQAITEQKIFDAVEAKQKAEASALMGKFQQQEAETASLKEALLQQEAEAFAIKELARQQEVEALVTKELNRQRDAKLGAARDITPQHEINVAVQDTNAFNQIRQQAMLDYGVPELEQQLKVAMQKDRQDTEWERFQSDSPVTAAIRDRLVAARLAAEQSILTSTSSKKMLSPR